MRVAEVFELQLEEIAEHVAALELMNEPSRPRRQLPRGLA